MAPADLSRLVLVGAMGIKPPQGDILDLAITGYVDYARAGFHDQKAFDRVYGAEPSIDQLEMWDICREMSFRIAWKPYMYSQTLPHLLGAVRAPALVVWGDDDKVVPQSAAKRYVEALPNAKLEIVKAERPLRRHGAARSAGQTGHELHRSGVTAMHLMYFTEQPMSAYPEQAGRDFGATALMLSNKHFDPVAGSRLYNEYIEQYMLAEEVGVDGIMLNEHHNAPFCMQAKANIFAAILAGMTKKVKIVMLGNPLPLAENPIRLAEELAMIDMISKGRLVSGFVRGGGQEQLATGVNPAFNRERFEEAHELIVRAWTRHRAVPLRGHALSAPGGEPVGGAAAEALPARLDSGRDQQGDDRVGSAAALSLHRAQHVDRADQEDLGALRQRGGRCRLCRRAGEPRLPDPGPCLRQRGEGDRERQAVPLDAGRVHRPRASGVEHALGLRLAVQPPRLRRVRRRTRVQNPRGETSFEQQMADLRIIAGTPKTVVAKLKRILEETRPGILALWGNDGRVSQADSLTCIRLIGQEVFPAIREIAKSLDLKSPFEADAPVHLRYSTDLKPASKAAAAE